KDLQHKHDTNDVLDYKLTNSLWFKLAAIFDKKKSTLIKDQGLIKKELRKVVQNVNADEWLDLTIIDNPVKDSIEQLEQANEKLEVFLNDENDRFKKEYDWFNYWNKLDDQKTQVIES